MDRKACRRCGLTRAQHVHARWKPKDFPLLRHGESHRRVTVTAKTGPGAEAAAKEASAEDTAQQPCARPPGPEQRCAEATEQAAALKTSAAALMKAGLVDKARELELAATELEKQSLAPPPGKRLDMMQGYRDRCAGRLEKATKLVEATEAARAEALQKREEATLELKAAQSNLEKLKAQLAGADGTGADEDEDASMDEQDIRREMAEPRAAKA